MQVEAQAQSRPASPTVGGNPLDSLPQIKAPDKGPNVTMQVAPQAPQLQELLARHLTPSQDSGRGREVHSVRRSRATLHAARRQRHHHRRPDPGRQRRHEAVSGPRLCALVRVHSRADVRRRRGARDRGGRLRVHRQGDGQARRGRRQDPRDRRPHRCRPAVAARHLRALHQRAGPVARRESRGQRGAAAKYRRRHHARIERGAQTVRRQHRVSTSITPACRAC